MKYGIRNGLHIERMRRDKLLLSLIRDIAHEQNWEHKGWYDAVLRNM